MPTLEELVGVSEHTFAISCVDGEEAKVGLSALLKSLDPLTYPVSIEEEDQRKLKVYLEYYPANLHFVIDHLSPLDVSNVLLTRAERHRSGVLPGSRLETDHGHAGRWNGGDCAAQSQGGERLDLDHPSEVKPIRFYS
jgi:hypothetical protein